MTLNSSLQRPFPEILIRDEIQLSVLGSSDAELDELERLYTDGFGDHLPLTRDQHRILVENGDVIGARNTIGELVAFRAMVYDAKHSIPHDICIKPHQAYQNHTVVRSDQRGSGVGRLLLPPAVELATARGKQSIITSVSPVNGRNLGMLTKQGYRVVIYSPNHFGIGEDRYMLEYRFWKTLEVNLGNEPLPAHVEVGSPQLIRGIGQVINSLDILSAQALLRNGQEGVFAYKSTQLNESLILFVQT